MLLVLIGVAGVVLSNQARVDADWVEHTLQVEKQIGQVLLTLRRAESSERAYIITRLREYREDYGEAAREVMPQFRELRSLMADNPAQARLLDQMQPLIERRLSDFANAISAVENNDRATAEAIVQNLEGKNSTDQIRTVAERMAAIESRLLKDRRAQSENSSSQWLGVTLGGALLVFILAALSIVILRRSMKERDEAEQTLVATNRNLEKIVEDRSGDLKDANEEIQRFAYIVSHDLRSPLVNIMGFTAELEVWRDDVLARLKAAEQEVPDVSNDQEEDGDEADVYELAGEFDESLAFIKSSIAKMDRLINAILELSRAGRREFHAESLDMDKLVESLADSLAHQAAESESEITVETLPDVRSDRLAIEQIFSNLLDNALKYLREGVPGEIVVSGYDEPLHVVYEVKDNGRGIDDKDYERIFDLFRRAGQQDKPGEGIGLAHVRTLVRRLGGRMTVKSEVGKGSVFTVTLPKYWAGERSAA